MMSCILYKNQRCDFMRIFIPLTKEEEKLARDYAKSKGITLEEAFKNALFTKIKSEYDIAAAEEAPRESKKDTKPYSMEEVVKGIGDNI